MSESVQRFGVVVEAKPERLEEYKRLHANVWPEVRARMTECHLRNFSIFGRRFPDGRYYLFSYYEYTGTDYAADMEKLAADPKVQEWWDITKPCHIPFPDRAEGEWWASMEEMCYLP